MLDTHYTATLLDLEDVKITNVENISNQIYIHLELPRRKHRCPACSTETDHIHDYRLQKIKDIPLGRNTFLLLRKRRYSCASCGKRFYENNQFLPRYHRVTSRLVASVIQAFRKSISATEISKHFNISTMTALRYFDLVQYSRKTLPKVLSIDEFKGNADRQKYQTILTDPSNKSVLDILPNRFEADLIRYFKQFPDRKQVQYFITDMNPHFRAVAQVCFPNATIVADRFHVVRQVIWAMERVRKEEQKKLSAQHRRYFKRSKSLLSKNYADLSDADMEHLALMFEIAPRLATAYRLKNQCLDILHAESSAIAKPQLAFWIHSVENTGFPEFKDCTTAFHNWFQEIMNALDVPWSNGFTEGCNNKTKVLKRACYGIQRFSRLRNRILLAHS